MEDGEHRFKQRLEKLTRIGIALSGERELSRLLELIVDAARALTNADGGTLYLAVGDPPEALRYYIMQTGSTNFRAGGTSGNPIPAPNIPLGIDGRRNHSNISAYTANTGKTVNIPDWRAYDGFDFTGPRTYEEDFGYVSKSFLVVALRDHEEQIIGVLQLINALDRETGEKIPFSTDDVGIIEALASQAAVAITNVRLIRETENLFDSFAEAMASAIDERSPATAGHIKRVTMLTVALAEAVNQEQAGRFAEIRFTRDEMNELRLAALLHDVGKVTTPLHVVEKHGKLETIYDRIHEVCTRFDLIRRTIEVDCLAQKVALMRAGSPPEALADLDAGLQARLQEVAEEKAFITEVNVPVEFLPPEKVERIKAIGAKTYCLDGQERPYLEPDELKNLTVQRGNITGEELEAMRDHAAVSIRLLSQIPFTRKLRNIPRIAGAHHEFLNGKGYPLGLSGDEIPIHTRMMTIADIYDAVTASDRSYKQGRSQEEAVEILRKAAKFGEIDPDLLELFLRAGVYKLTGKPRAEEAETEQRAGSPV